MPDSPEEVQRSILEAVDDALDDYRIRGTEFDVRLVNALGRAGACISDLVATITRLRLELEHARDRGDTYLGQAIRNNEKYEHAMDVAVKAKEEKL